jgi:hypothetical protein
VFFTETHLNNQITDDDIAISGFDVPFRKDRNSHGGGIIMYHKSNINILRRVDLEHEHVESMWFELKTKVHPILININYRSELQSHTFYWQFFDLMLKQALDENSHIICLGDLNKNLMVVIPNSTLISFLIRKPTLKGDISSIVITDLSTNFYCI